MLLDGLRSARRLLQGARAVLHRPGGRYTVADRFEEQVRKRGDAPFMLFEDHSLSWRETEAAANRVAHWAMAQGLESGDVVALLMENRPDYVITWLGLAKLGVVSALINTNLSGKALDHALETSEAEHLVVGAELLEALATASSERTQALHIWVSPDPAQGDAALPAGAKDLGVELEDAPDDAPDPSVRGDLRTGDVLFYIYTSGTTGNPKAARFSHARFLVAGDGFAWAAETGPDDVEYLALPLYHSAGGVVAVGRVLAGGGALAIRRRFSASQFWDDVRRYEATCFQYIGEFCRYLMAQPERPDDRDHHVRVAAGNGLRPDVWEAFQERFGIPKIIEFYGATEGNTVMINLSGKVGAVGYYPPYLDFLNNARIVKFDVATETHPRDGDGFCIECAPGEPGEMLGRISSSDALTAGRFEGYTSREASEKKVLRDVFKKGDAWFRTGDLLTRDREGYYYFVDRIGDTFRWKGENVSTQEVAELLSGFPGIGMVNVYGVQVPGHDGRAGMLAFVPEDGAAFDGEAFYRYVAARLPAYAAPIFVRILPEAEVTGTFKLRKVELQKQGFDPEQVPDRLFVRDEAASAYVPLTPQRAAEIRSGAGRL
jgi:fatty-acyl-CoA synthase